MPKPKGKVVFCTPSLAGPTRPYIAALEASIPLIVEAGWEELYAQEVGNPYISCARAYATRKALDQKPDSVIYLDYDLSWDAGDLLRLLETEGDVVAGTYRYKKDEEEYMGALIEGPDNRPQVRRDGAVRAHSVPAGFLKIKCDAIRHFMRAYPELLFGDPSAYSVDLFSHGAHRGVWYGEDMAFCRRWRECDGEIWIVPDLNITHWNGEKPYHGNFHEFLLRQPGGSKAA